MSKPENIAISIFLIERDNPVVLLIRKETNRQPNLFTLETPKIVKFKTATGSVL